MRRYYKPMLAQSAKTPFTAKEWVFEIKWDGFRAISYINDELEIRSRNNKELRYIFPELRELRILTRNTVLDGEVVAMHEGKPDFQTLLERNKGTSTRDIEYVARKHPVIYVVFDILEKDGKPLLNLPLIDRKKILKENVQEGKSVVLSEFIEMQGEAYFQAALKRGLEGIMAKKITSPYEPGIRSSNWLKIKGALSCDCVIFGFTIGEGAREQTFGALILGLYDAGRPVYIGKVGTGFSQDTMEALLEIFESLKTKNKAFQDAEVPERVTWLKPELVCEVAYQSITNDGRLRMPRFHGLRADKPPLECTLNQIR